MARLVQTELMAEAALARSMGRGLNLAIAEPRDWIKAADALVSANELDAATTLVRALAARPESDPWVRRISMILESAPPLRPGDPVLRDDDQEVLVLERPGADGVLLAFCGRALRMGMPIGLFHRWAARLPVSVVYLRERTQMHYLAGLKSLGGALRPTLEGLRRMVEGLGARRVFCVGHSSGGYGALRYGIELGAESVLCAAAPFDLSEGFNRDLRKAAAAALVRQGAPDEALDLRPLYLAADPRPRLRIVYGEHQWDDRIHAEHMHGLEGASLHPLSDWDGHAVMSELALRGELGPLLEELVA